MRAFTRRFEISNHGFNINAFSCKQAIQRFARFLKRCDICIGLAVGRDEVANGLTMTCHSNRRAGRYEFSHSGTKFPNTYFSSFHFFLCSQSHIVDQSVHNIRVDDCELMQWPVSLPMTDLALLGHIMGHPAEVGEGSRRCRPGGQHHCRAVRTAGGKACG